MSALDLGVLGGLLLVFLLIGLTGPKTTDTASEYFLADRSLRWYQIGFSLFATNFSASALIGITGAAYVIGIAIYNYEWVGILILVFFAVFMVRVVRRSQAYTIAEYLARRYDDRTRTLYSAFIIFLLVFIDMAGSLYAGGLLLEQFLPGLSSQAIIIVLMLLVGLYSVVGGMSAISRTDIFQSLVLIAGAVMITIFVAQQFGSWEEFVAGAPDQSLNLIRPISDRAVPWTGLIIGVPLIGAYFWLVNQNMVQFVLGAESETEATRGLLFAGALKIIGLLCIVLPAIAVAAIIPGLDTPDRIYPTMISTLLPTGMLGFVLAGFAAALMSNADSTLHAASTLITMDFVHRRKPGAGSERMVRTGRITTCIIIAISAVWAPQIARFGTLFEYVQGLMAYAVAPFVVVYLGGMFWSRATAFAAFWALVGGLLTAVTLWLLVYGLEWVDIHYLHVPMPIAFVSAILLVTLSLSRPPAPVDPVLIWSRRTGAQSRSRLDAGLALGVIVMTCATVVVFF